MPKANRSPFLHFPEGVLPRELLSDPALLAATSGPNAAYTTYIRNNLIQTPIIPLFSYTAFNECLSRPEWETIDLACRLASHFVTDHNMLPFWMRVSCGRLERDWSQGEEVYYLEFTTPTKKEDLEQYHKETKNAIGKLARRVKFTKMRGDSAGDGAASRGDGVLSWGEKYAYAKAYADDKSGLLSIGIHADVLKHISKMTPKPSSSKRTEDPTSSKWKPAQWKNTRAALTQDQEEQFYEYLRFQFTLACSLVDQAVALFFHFTQAAGGTSNHKLDLNNQPFYCQEIIAETDPLALRYSWQMLALGCKVEQWHNSYPLDPRGKIREKVDVPTSTFLHTYYTVETGMDRVGKHTTVLPMEWVVSWFLRPISSDDFERWSEELGTNDLPKHDPRPMITNAAVLVCQETKIVVEGKKDTVELWGLEKYNHDELAANGGFDMLEEQDETATNGELDVSMDLEQEDSRGRSRMGKMTTSASRALVA
jgi:hypothetical protein